MLPPRHPEKVHSTVEAAHSYRMEGILNVLRDSNILVFIIVYLSFLLDNVLLTVVGELYKKICLL